jgi:AcrR family transcriptional regulator
MGSMVARSERIGERRRAAPRSREDVLDAAARAFSKRGYHDTTMKDVATELGLTPGALYSYFESKESLFGAVVERMRSQLLEAIEAPVPSGMSLEHEVELLLLRLFELTERYRGEFATFIDAPALGFAEKPGEAMRGFELLRAKIVAWFSEPRRRERLAFDPELAATTFTGTAIALMRVRVIDCESESLLPLAPVVRDLFIRGACRGGDV